MKISRMLLMIVVTILFVSITTGCKSNSNTSDNESVSDSNKSVSDSNGPSIEDISTIPGGISESGVYVYMPAYIPIPSPPGHRVEHVNAKDGKVFFTASELNPGKRIAEESLWSMNIDGSDLIEINNYTAWLPTFKIEGGAIKIVTSYIDHDDFLWVIEFGTFFDVDDAIHRIPTLRKLDASGAEILSIDISFIYPNNYLREPITFCIDGDGYIYINYYGDIFVLSSNGSLLHTLNLQGRINTQIIKLNDGNVVGFGWRGMTPVLRYLNMQNREWGETIELPPMNIKTVFPGNDEFVILFNDGSSLYGVTSGTWEAEHILSWIDIGLNTDGINTIKFLPDGRLYALSFIMRWTTSEFINELIMLEKVPIEDMPEKTVLSLATFKFDGYLRYAVLHFNKNSTTHKIQVTDYSVFNTHENHLAGLTRLNTEIIAGRIPDLMDTSSIPFDTYAARGLFVDMNPFLDADPEINRSGLMDNILRVSEIDGSLYRLFPVFKISTMFGNPFFVGSEPGWNLSEFKATLIANPQADIPLGSNTSQESILKLLFQHDIGQFIDWDSGAVNFESDYFTDMLEVASMFPPERDTYEQGWDEYLEGLKAGREIIRSFNFGGFRSFIVFRIEFGGEIVLKGFPVENRAGNKLSIDDGVAITVGCADKQGAWDFVRTFLTESYQREYILDDWFFSVNRKIFEEGLAEALEIVYPLYDPVYFDKEVSQEEADKIMAFVGSVSGVLTHDETLWNIVSESASEYFAGYRTAQDTARIIQNRAMRYMAEMN